MKSLLFAAIIIGTISCTNTVDSKAKESASVALAQKEDIIGIWELLKHSYKPSQEPEVIDPMFQEYLEIKKDGTYKQGKYTGIWFLSYSDEYIIDSNSKVIFTQISELETNRFNEYNRRVSSHQAKVDNTEGAKYLYLTSLHTSGTKVYIKKN